MKKLLILISILMSQTVCFAYETVNLQLGNDYLVITERCVNSTIVSEPKVFTLTPFFTIANEKNIILLHPLKQGSTNLTVLMGKKYETFRIRIVPQDENLSDETITRGDFEFILLDSLPVYGESDIDKPPVGVE